MKLTPDKRATRNQSAFNSPSSFGWYGVRVYVSPSVGSKAFGGALFDMGRIQELLAAGESGSEEINLMRNAGLASQFVGYLGGCVNSATLGYFFGAPLRRNVREMYGIPERDSFCGSDFATSLFCYCCSSIQLAHHMKKQHLPNKSDN